MGVNQRIEKSVYTPDRNYRSQMYGPLLTGASSRQTPGFTGTLIGQNITEMLSSVSNTTSKVAEHLLNLEINTQRRADDNALTMANTFYQNQQSSFVPQVDNDKGKMAVDSAVNDFKTYASGLEGVSQEGRTRLEEMQKVLGESYKSKQRFGRAKLIEQQSETIHRTNVEQAIKSGDVDSLMSWHKAADDKNYKFKTDLKTMVSNTMRYKQINKIQNYTVTELKIEDELMQEVDDKGSSKVFQGMNIDDVRLYRRELSGLIAQKQHDNHKEMIKGLESGEIDSAADVWELYKKDKVSLKVAQGMEKSFNARNKKNMDKIENDMLESIYEKIEVVSPVAKKQHFNKLQDKVDETSLDIKTKIRLSRYITARQSADNKPKSDQLNDNKIYGTRLLKEKIFEKFKVVKFSPGNFWGAFGDHEKEYKNRTEDMQKSELKRMLEWIDRETPSIPEIEAYTDNIQKKYAKKKVSLEFYRTHMANVTPRRILNAMKGEATIRRSTADGKIVLFDSKTKKFIRYE